MDEPSKLCRRCGETKPISAFSKRKASRDGLQHQCRPCASRQFREYRNADLARDRARVRAYGAANRESLRERARRDYAERPNDLRAASRRYYERHRTKVLAAASAHGKRRRAAYSDEDRRRIRQYMAAWRSENRERAREYVRRWQREHPEQKRERTRRRRAKLKASVLVPFSAEQLAARLSMFNGCWMCGGPKEHVDHVKPLAKGGAHTVSALRPACGPCNATKSDKWPYPVSPAGLARPRLPLP